MTQDELIDLAKQANGEPAWSGGVDWTWQELEAFTKLVEDKVRQDIIEKNAPVIKSINDHIRTLEKLLKERGQHE